MTKNITSIIILSYPGALKSAIYGFEEIFMLANDLCIQNSIDHSFSISIIEPQQIKKIISNLHSDCCNAVIIPPGIGSKFCQNPDKELLKWLRLSHSSGSIICSVCAGVFILAKTGLLNGRKVTTHWGLASDFSHKFQEVILDIDEILINDGDIITSGGLMAWVDLALELVTQFTNISLMRQLARHMVIDSGHREQRYYKVFSPALNHKDKAILSAQHYIQKKYNSQISVCELSNLSCLGERTFLRKFVKATGLKPTEYIQKTRIQKACELIESTPENFSTIAHLVGYEDISSFRKIFTRVTGLSPRDFKMRFAGK